MPLGYNECSCSLELAYVLFWSRTVTPPHYGYWEYRQDTPHNESRYSYDQVQLLHPHRKVISQKMITHDTLQYFMPRYPHNMLLISCYKITAWDSVYLIMEIFFSRFSEKFNPYDHLRKWRTMVKYASKFQNLQNRTHPDLFTTIPHVLFNTWLIILQKSAITWIIKRIHTWTNPYANTDQEVLNIPRCKWDTWEIIFKKSFRI